MSETAPFPADRRMTADEFIDWAMGLPDGERYELVDGRPFAMAPERATHARLKAAAWLELRDDARAAGLGCEAFPDGMSIVIDEATVFEPDAILRCGERLGPNEVKIVDPVVVVEVLSPSTRAFDLGAKLSEYFRIPSLHHYLIFNTEHRRVIHHRRGAGDEIAKRIVTDPALALDPPGLTLDLRAMFDEAEIAAEE